MDALPIKITDLVILAVLLFSGFHALANGLVRSVLSFAGWIAAIVATLRLFDLARPYARNLIGDPTVADIAAGAAIFLATLVVATLIAAAAGSAMRRTSLSALDRTLGFVFGLARGGLVVAILYLGISWIIPPNEQPAWIKEARALPLVDQTAAWLRDMAPPELRTRLGVATTDADRRLQQTREADRALRALTTPRAQTNPPPPASETGYKTEDRRRLEQLLQSADPPAPAAPPPPPSQVAR